MGYVGLTPPFAWRYRTGYMIGPRKTLLLHDRETGCAGTVIPALQRFKFYFRGDDAVLEEDDQ